VIVTDDFRRRLLASNLKGIGFRPTVLKRIVQLDWRSWDLQAEEPPKYPAGGEPENYILGRKHNPRIASEVGPLWEVVIDALLDDPGDADFVRTAPTALSRVLVRDRARAWLDEEATDSISFEDHHS
jgi:hypothetical protein